MTTAEAPSREAVLSKVPQFVVNNGRPIFKRHHLKRELLIGLLGLKGDGKSFGGAIITLNDFLIENLSVWSNMTIKCTFDIGKDTALRFGLDEGGIVTYETKPLNKRKLLNLDPEYEGGCLFIDEINMEFAEVRRSISNINLYFDRVVQQLRKYQTSMIYTVINEMWIDPRLRELTDIFIKCEDTALTNIGLAQKKTPGENFKWIVFPMTRYLIGKPYTETKRHLPPVYIKTKSLQGIYDDKQMQARGMKKYTTDLFGKEAVTMETIKSGAVANEEDKWGWLRPAAEELLSHSEQYIPTKEFYSRPEIQAEMKARGIKKEKVVSEQLHALYYISNMNKSIDNEMVRVFKLPTETEKVLV